MTTGPADVPPPDSSPQGPAGEPAFPPIDMASDPGLRRVAEVSRAWGVAPSVVLGRRRRATVVVDPMFGRTIAQEWDEEWLDWDRDVAVALLDWEAGLCPGCAQPLAETTDPTAEFRYHADPPIRCHYCTARARAAAVHGQNTDHAHAVLYRVREVEYVEPERVEANPWPGDDELQDQDEQPREDQQL